MENDDINKALSEIFAGSNVVFVEVSPPRHALRMPARVFSVDLGARASLDLAAFISDPQNGFMRHDSRDGVELGSQPYPQAFMRRGGPLMLAIPEGTEDLCVDNLKKQKDGIQAIMKYNESLQHPAVEWAVNRHR